MRADNANSELRHVRLDEPIGVDLRRPEAELSSSKSLTLVCGRYERPITRATPAGEHLGEFGLLPETAQGRTRDTIVPEECLEQHLFEKGPIHCLACSNLHSTLPLIGSLSDPAYLVLSNVTHHQRRLAIRQRRLVHAMLGVSSR